MGFTFLLYTYTQCLDKSIIKFSLNESGRQIDQREIRDDIPRYPSDTTS